MFLMPVEKCVTGVSPPLPQFLSLFTLGASCIASCEKQVPPFRRNNSPTPPKQCVRILAPNTQKQCVRISYSQKQRIRIQKRCVGRIVWANQFHEFGAEEPDVGTGSQFDRKCSPRTRTFRRRLHVLLRLCNFIVNTSEDVCV